ncbi:hypothetical protein L6452_20156 [Arctium lappa]|uniref:Uncharacterized protein n=1 Tax=Arctium lappa TaxID=4217 RepID=A0ACB9BBY0_ARCLA|nr:hypothetical protein L6452_20156 [Arctium lappa]
MLARCSSNLTNYTITNSYGAFPDHSTCRTAKVTYPSSEQDLILAVATTTQTHIKIRVATCSSHSILKLVCPAGDDGLIISTQKLHRVIEIDKDSGLVTLESGVTLRQLIDEAAITGLALP